MDDVKSRVLELLAEGLSNDEIAQRLGVTPGTVAAHKAHVTMGTYGDSGGGDATVGSEEVEGTLSLKFGLERDMQTALRANIDQLDPTLSIVDGGKERHVEAGFIDILAQDRDGSLVVIELKSGAAPDGAVTQVLAYIGSLQAEKTQQVRGILVAREFPKKVRFAAHAAGIQLVQYGYNFTFAVIGGQGDEAGQA